MVQSPNLTQVVAQKTGSLPNAFSLNVFWTIRTVRNWRTEGSCNENDRGDERFSSGGLGFNAIRSVAGARENDFLGLSVCGDFGGGLVVCNQRKAGPVATEVAKEATLKTQFESKAFQVANLPALRQQMVDMEAQFGALLRQLPSDTEVPGLLEDITSTGIGAVWSSIRSTFSPRSSASTTSNCPSRSVFVARITSWVALSVV